MSTPNGPTYSVPPAEATPPPPPSRGRVSRGTGIAIAAVVVIVLVILALFLAGVIPGLKSSGTSPTPTASTYSVTFSEGGLAAGTSWSVTLGGATQSGTGASLVFSEKNGTYPYTVGTVTGYAAHPASGSVVVAGAAVTQAISFAGGYSISFDESGLPTGTTWSVTFNGTSLSSTTASVAFSASNGTYAYSVGTVSGYTASPAAGSVTVAGAAQSVAITFTKVLAGQYPVTFTESGLPAGTSWSATLNGTLHTSATSTISFNMPNGTYAYSIGIVSGYTASPASGQAAVAGTSVSVSISFTATTGLSGPEYPITWDQTGLPLTDLWTVGGYILVGGHGYIFGQTSAGASNEFSLPNGSYVWTLSTTASGYIAVPSYANLTVAGGPVTISVKFAPVYNVTFTETGLSAFASWAVVLNYTESTSTGSGNNTFELPDGTYAFTASSLGYLASPASGTVTVNGVAVVVGITFTSVPTYTITFTESGLPTGTLWSVSVNGSYAHGAVAPSSVIYLGYPNGQYPYVVSVVGYYTVSPATGTVTVASANVAQPVAFTAIPTYAVTFTETGLPTGASWSVDLNVSSATVAAPTTISLSVPAGVNDYFVSTSAYYSAHPAFGSVSVTTAGASVGITFSAIPPLANYTVNFTETGLPALTPFWSIYAVNDGQYISSNYTQANFTSIATSLNLTLPDGNYTWIATSYLPNFTADPMAGYFTISGHALSVSVTFVNSSGKYLVAFAEEWFEATGAGGIPNGTSWSVTIGGQTQITQGMDLFFLLPNGTKQAYSIAPPTGYLALPGYGNLTGYANPSPSLTYYTDSPVVAVVFVVDPPAVSVHGGPAPASAGLTASLIASPLRRS